MLLRLVWCLERIARGDVILDLTEVGKSGEEEVGAFQRAGLDRCVESTVRYCLGIVGVLKEL